MTDWGSILDSERKLANARLAADIANDPVGDRLDALEKEVEMLNATVGGLVASLDMFASMIRGKDPSDRTQEWCRENGIEAELDALLKANQ